MLVHNNSTNSIYTKKLPLIFKVKRLVRICLIIKAVNSKFISKIK